MSQAGAPASTARVAPVADSQPEMLRVAEPMREMVIGAVDSDNMASAETQKLLLFTTRTCPNCQSAVEMLQQASLPFEKIVAEESPELARQYAVRSAPTLLVLGEQTERFNNASEIQGFVSRR
jgi:ribonucleoside-triphosphate reductase